MISKIKKYILLLILIAVPWLTAAASVSIETEEGTGEFGIQGKCGRVFNNSGWINSWVYSGSVFYDFAKFNGKLGILAGFEGASNIDDQQLFGMKLGIRAYRFISAGPTVFFLTDQNNNVSGKFGAFANLSIPFKYFNFGVEFTFISPNIFTIGGTIGFTIPTKVN